MTASVVAPPGPGRRRLPFWVIVAAGGAITSISLGARSTFGLFLEPVVDTIGSDRGTFAFAVAVQNIVWGLAQPVAGGLADRFGTARVLATGGVLYALSLVVMAGATTGGVVLISAGFLTGMAVAAASFTVVLSAVGRMASPERRSMALGIVSAAGSIGQFVLIPVIQWLIDSSSWPTAAAVLGAITLVIVALAPAMRGRAADHPDPAARGAVGPSLRSDLAKATRAPAYLLLNAAFFVCGFHVTFIATHLPGYAESIDVSASTAAVALALIGLFNVFGSLAAGWLGARHSNTKLLAGIYGLRALVIATYVVVPTTGTSTVVFGAAMGVLWLSTVPLTSAMVTTQFGTANVGTLFGIVFLSHQMGAFGGAWLGGALADATGDYRTAWWIAVGLGVMAMILHLVIEEGPIPDLPDRARHPRPAPAAGLAVAVLVIGIGGAMSPGRVSAADFEVSGGLERVCVLGG